jgi:hypothetical protein
VNLYPTPTRIQLLRDIANAQVFTDLTADTARVVLCPYAPTEWQTQQTVTKRVQELESAGWVAETDGADWVLTDAGREILRGAE